MAAAEKSMYLARCELGGRCKVFRVDTEVVRLPDYNKPRARILKREPRAWLFDARRTALGEQLCPPGAAAVDYTEAAALKAAMSLLAKYQRAVNSKR